MNPMQQDYCGEQFAPRKLKDKNFRGPTEFHGIGELCEAMGVSRTHLWLVVTGQRRSPHAARWRAALDEKRRAA